MTATTRTWRGDYPAVTEIHKLALSGTWSAVDTITFTINGKPVVIVVGSTTIATICTNLAAALTAIYNSATGIPEFKEFTTTAESADILLTAVTPGVPLTIGYATSGSGVLTATTPTVATGPNFWDQAANWSPSGVPATGDTVIFKNNASDVLYGLGQSAVTLAAMQISANYTGKIGLPRTNANGYFEYRADYLAISATTLTVGDGDGAGSQRIKIDVGTNQCALYVYRTATSLENGLPSFLWKGTHASNTVSVSRGSVGIAVLPSELATVATLLEGFVTNATSDANVVVGSGVTLTTIAKSGGNLQTSSNVVTINLLGAFGTYDFLAGNLTTLNGDGAGNFNFRSTGTITNTKVGKGCVLDFSRDPNPRTVTNCTPVQAGATITDPNKTVTWTNGIILGEGVSLDDVTLSLGPGRTYGIT